MSHKTTTEHPPGEVGGSSAAVLGRTLAIQRAHLNGTACDFCIYRRSAIPIQFEEPFSIPN